MLYPMLAIITGLFLLIWSADRFVDGAAATARHFGMSPLLIGIVIIGFGTSAPEMIVSAISALNGNPGIALGNAYGSNITNIALILGATALIRPLTVPSQIIKQELPVLLLITFISAVLIYDTDITRIDAVILLAVFCIYMTGSIRLGLRQKNVALTDENKTAETSVSLKSAVIQVIAGLGILLLSSQLLVWGAVEIARYFAVSDLIIGLTIVAVGTSLPELASSVAAARKGEQDLAIGNIVGSNLFNTLAVVGIAGIIKPIQAGSEIFSRDMTVMVFMTLLLFIFGYHFSRQQGRITRFKGFILLLCYVAYNTYLFYTAL